MGYGINHLNEFPLWYGIILGIIEVLAIVGGVIHGYSYKSDNPDLREMMINDVNNNAIANSNRNSTFQRVFRYRSVGFFLLLFIVAKALITLCLLVYSNIVFLSTRYSGTTYQVYNNYLVSNDSLDFSGLNDTLWSDYYLSSNVASYNITLKADVDLSDCSVLTDDEIKATNQLYAFFHSLFQYYLPVQSLMIFFRFSLITMKIVGFKVRQLRMFLFLFLVSLALSSGRFPLSMFKFTNDCLVPIKFVEIALIPVFLYMILSIFCGFIFVNNTDDVCEMSIEKFKGCKKVNAVTVLILYILWLILGVTLNVFNYYVLIYNNWKGVVMFIGKASDEILHFLESIFTCF